MTVVDQAVTAVLLFNPWSNGEWPCSSSSAPNELANPSLLPSEDSCYYPDTSELDEYVLSSQGRIWVGSADSNYGKPWQFAQFTTQALQVALYLLDTLTKKDRADPIQVCKSQPFHTSAAVCITPSLSSLPHLPPSPPSLPPSLSSLPPSPLGDPVHFCHCQRTG